MAAEWALPASASAPAPAAAAQARCDACGRDGGWRRGRHNGKLVGGFMQHAHTDRGAHTHTHTLTLTHSEAEAATATEAAKRHESARQRTWPKVAPCECVCV